MNNPIKVIWRYKNNNKKIHHHVYIFVGEVSVNIKKILKKIQSLSLYDSLVSLSKDEIETIEKQYGENWYKTMFNIKHIDMSINTIKKETEMQNKIIKLYGKEWYEKHISKYELSDKQLIYSYEETVKFDLERVLTKKERAELLEAHVDAIDFKIGNAMYGGNSKHSGGAEDEIDAGDIVLDDLEKIDVNVADIAGELSDIDVDIDNIDLDIEQDIENIYQESDVTVDDNTKETKKSIQKVLKDSNYIDNAKNDMVAFDASNDDIMYDGELKDIYEKNFIYNNYIYKDDTIKNVKTKICCSMLNNKKFEIDYLLPSRQYLWGEYFYEEQQKKVMIGQKWVRRTDLLDIDIVPIENIRYYEDLRGNLRILRDSLKRYGSRIRREDDDNNILYDYDDYYSNDEIFMLDVYNEFGKDYDPEPEIAKNITDVYLRLYFPKLKANDVTNVFKMLKGDPKSESSYVNNVFSTLLNDMIMENEITDIVENVRKNIKSKHKFQDSYVTQNAIYLRLRILSGSLDLYRIFNEFKLTDDYTFVKYQSRDNKSFFKLNDDKILEHYGTDINKEVLQRWFESTITAQYGISFKIKVVENESVKFTVVNLTENGRLEYKTQWKEQNMATIKDIIATYKHIRLLIDKINGEDNKVKFALPLDNEFKFAFINSIQKFELPDKYEVDHNDLSEFSRFFYPYVSLVIEPRKRVSKQSKDSEISKYGTYLRYKKISKYDNSVKIEKRVLHFIKNYDMTPQALISEISKQFNITEERAQNEIEMTKTKYPFLKKARKQLKKLDTLPKYKLPGISIDIQGKQKENYKIRISGARSIEQLNRITQFMNVLIYLYVETYLLKLPERKKLRDKLKELTNIASRRNKVSDVVKRDDSNKDIKQMIKYDKRRLGFKPEEGQNQWSRACQNSGTKRRRPYPVPTVDELLKDGYVLNKSNGMYEKTVSKNGKKSVIRAVKLSEIDEGGKPTGNSLYYACNPKENGEYIYVGFLTKSRNPFGLCMPCCFKKDPYDTVNNKKRDFFLKCTGDDKGKVVEEESKLGDVLYILQDTNKLQENRLSFLPNFLDIFMNKMLGNKIKMDQHYLGQTFPEYFFKLGVSQEKNRLLTAVSVLIDITPEQIIRNIKKALRADDKDMLFTHINSGETKLQFKTREKYMNYLNVKDDHELSDLNDFFKIPGIVTKTGISIVIFKKFYTTYIDKNEKQQKKEDFDIICSHTEDSEELKHNNVLFIVSEDSYYYPIIMINKDTSKKVTITKLFNSKDNKIINHIFDYYTLNCKYGSLNDTLFSGKNQLTAHQTQRILKDKVTAQIVDSKNRAYYLIAGSNIIPIKRSGSIYDIVIQTEHDKYVQSYDKTYRYLLDIYNKSNKMLDVKPVGIYFKEKKGMEYLYAEDIICHNGLHVPIKKEKMTLSKLNKDGMIYDRKPFYEIEDIYLKSLNEDVSYVDERINVVNRDKYNTEMYHLFRLELSSYLSTYENREVKTYLLQIINSQRSTMEKRDILKGLLYYTVDPILGKLFLELKKDNLDAVKELNMKIGKSKNKSFVELVNSIPDLSKYSVKNIRESCSNLSKRKCATHIHCDMINSDCMMILTKEMTIEFINRVVGEMLLDVVKVKEIFRQDGYTVLDIVDRTRFTQRKDEKIITLGAKIESPLLDLLKLDNVDNKKRQSSMDAAIAHYNYDNMLNDTKTYYSQRIINNENSVIRAYANCYYWLLVPYQTIENRNLGYYSTLQTDISDYLKGMVIDWLLDRKHSEVTVSAIDMLFGLKLDIKTDLKNYVLKWASETDNTRCTLELFVLSHIYEIPIFIYDQNDTIVYIMYTGIKYSQKHNTDKKSEYKGINKTESINVRLNYDDKRDIPFAIDAIYMK